MASANPISSSCQSIISAGNNSNTTASGLAGASDSLRSTTSTHYIIGTGSLGRLKYHHKHKSLDASDEELDYSQLSQSTHILGRVKSDRFLASKPDEDRRRRTIIIEKRNDSFGFTLQSYGIHYKRDEEVEMITYVDYVEYDGPAYRSGMREGDVILSINGVDMEKADHKTLVDFIKSCDARMRMVVLFEDCVRKVDLHMRYIQLQNILQSKMNELERICLRERELLEGKWKTHSLPARKKTTTSPTDAADGRSVSPHTSDGGDLPYYRPTLSTEDVAHMPRYQLQQTTSTIIPPPAQFMLTYHYMDPTYRYVLRPSTVNTSGGRGVGGGYYVSIDGDAGEQQLQRSPSDQQNFILSHADSMETNTASGSGHFASLQRNTGKHPPAPPPRTCEKHKPPSHNNSSNANGNSKQQSQVQSKTEMASAQKANQKSSSKHCHGHSCNPCIGHFKWKSAEKTAAANAATATGANGGGGGDNVSLDAYDLASPCCDTHCVPSRRRVRHHKEHTHKHKHRDRERDTKEHRAASQRPKSQSQAHTSPMTPAKQHVHHHHHITPIALQQQQQQQQQQHHHHHHQLQQQQQQQQQQQKPHHHHHHRYYREQEQQQQHQENVCDRNGSMRSRYFDLSTGLASHCSLHSCTSSDFAPADSTSYTTSLSTDTLFWDPNSENVTSRQHSTKSRQSFQQQQQQHPVAQQQQQHQQHHQQQQQQPSHSHIHHGGVYQHRYHITTTQVQPSQMYPSVGTYVYKPKSWDNLTTKAIGAYGYGYLDTVTMAPTVKLQIAQQRHSIPRKNPYGRYSTYTDVENYAPPPSQFVEELTTTTTTTTITAKSTEELIAVVPLPLVTTTNASSNATTTNINSNSNSNTTMTCDCLTKQQQQALKAAQLQLNQSQKLAHHNTCQIGYYSHLPRPTTDTGTSTATMNITNDSADIATVSEVTRL